MKEFDVTITETLKLTVSVEASSKEEAQQMVSDQWHAGDHILDADNFVEVEFESNDGKEISAEKAQDDTLEVLMVEPGQYPRVERIGSDLASLQKAVDGYPAEGGTWEYGFWDAKVRSYYTVDRCHGSTVVLNGNTVRSVDTAAGEKSIAEKWAVQWPSHDDRYYYRVCN